MAAGSIGIWVIGAGLFVAGLVAGLVIGLSIRGPAVAPPPLAPRPAPDAEGMERVRAALRDGNKIEAIKLYRELTGVGLKDAKDAVEAMEAR